jgi:cell division transport system permease protein
MNRLRRYLRQHARAARASLAELVRTPLATLFAMAVIGITLALPATLYLLVDNLRLVSRGLETGGQVSLYLKRGVPDESARALAERLRRLDGVARVEYIPPAQALAEFKALSGFGEALAALGENPLPGVLVVRPAHILGQNPAALEALARRLEKNAEVELVQLDLEWVRRLNAMLHLAERAVWLLGGLLALAVLLIIGNTIRLAVLNRRDEIEIVKIIGGTNAYIRRPFLYSGLLQGGLGAAVAWGLVAVFRLLLAGPAAELAGLYGSAFAPRGLTVSDGLLLIALGAGLGWLGSRLAVERHLRGLDPK